MQWETLQRMMKLLFQNQIQLVSLSMTGTLEDLLSRCDETLYLKEFKVNTILINLMRKENTCCGYFNCNALDYGYFALLYFKVDRCVFGYQIDTSPNKSRRQNGQDTCGNYD